MCVTIIKWLFTIFASIFLLNMFFIAFESMYKNTCTASKISRIHYKNEMTGAKQISTERVQSYHFLFLEERWKVHDYNLALPHIIAWLRHYGAVQHGHHSFGQTNLWIRYVCWLYFMLCFILCRQKNASKCLFGFNIDSASIEGSHLL